MFPRPCCYHWYRRPGRLLTGASGCGKSTTTGAALLRGHVTAGDDFVLVEPASSQAYALYDAIKLDRLSAQRLPALAADIANPDCKPPDKGYMHLFRKRPLSFASHMPISVILLPSLGGGPRTNITEASHGEAMRALVPSTILLVRGGEAETARKATSFIRGLPAYRCHLGSDPLEAADAVASFTRGLRR